MKTIKLTIGICLFALLFASCKDEKAEIAKQNVEEYTSYVDSIATLEYAEAYSNWESIEDGYNNHKSMASVDIDDNEERVVLLENVDNATLKYETYKTNLIAEKEKEDIRTSKSNFRKTLLGANYDDSGDMAFEWINKDNILSVYETFVNTVQTNKDSYSREDWDEIKLLYEAIDTRKNTVENEGLTSSDNRKIAGLKLKFAPMYTVNRMGAKSAENAEAKE
ncbi:hypothetical protein [Confluentibacter flavum]|uniref:Uncharacterized protein n=1 Tax=Confluentibacter flavum TaxID=1909700 RepID=A0A2N3HMD3_9FLAO|nr:hypothetical protein [Confluentibacter flavum]PKQ46095.1 hypothetical protein CSW08_04960 [Confluentibacter flavum]